MVSFPSKSHLKRFSLVFSKWEGLTGGFTMEICLPKHKEIEMVVILRGGGRGIS